MARVLAICAPGMDWAEFDARDHAGEIPRLAALRANGSARWLSGAPAGFGPSAAATILTGVQPEAHGVWRDEEAWAGGLRPSGKASWRVQPLWARLEAAGITTGSVDWPASCPGAGWPGLHIDDSFPESSGRAADVWALPLHCVPSNRREALRDRRVHASQITAGMLAPLLAEEAFGDRAYGDEMHALRIGMARASSVQAAAVWMLAESGESSPDAVFIHQPLLQQARRAFGGRHGGAFAAVAPGAWRLLDGLIGRLVDLAGLDCKTMVISPGWKDAPGVFLASGSGVVQDNGVEGVSLLDVVPTVLGLFGMEDPTLAGRRLTSMPAQAPLLRAPSPSAPGRLMPDPRMMGPLRLLGYKPPPRAPKTWRAQGLADLAALMLDRDPAGALRAADAALALDPDSVLALRVKVRAHVARREPEPLEDLAERLLLLAPERGWGALANGAQYILNGDVKKATSWLRKAEADPDIGALLTVGTLWIAAGRIANAARVFGAVVVIDPGNVTAEIGLAMAATVRRDFMAAEAGLHRARKREPGRPAIWLQLAQVYAKSGRKAEAAKMAATARRLGAAPPLTAAAEKGRLPV